MVHLSTHNFCFDWEIRKLSFNNICFYQEATGYSFQMTRLSVYINIINYYKEILIHFKTNNLTLLNIKLF